MLFRSMCPAMVPTDPRRSRLRCSASCVVLAWRWEPPADELEDDGAWADESVGLPRELDIAPDDELSRILSTMFSRRSMCALSFAAGASSGLSLFRGPASQLQVRAADHPRHAREHDSTYYQRRLPKLQRPSSPFATHAPQAGWARSHAT